ncbi:hypothetical protein VTN77DRAFT_4127 [Rasamsonia byssochlamydoides]|uniref:uncharacterized protein n=1 Tax=Rasamsonia byssochlamydoides TaxID=89139 RepID=UPI0037444913
MATHNAPYKPSPLSFGSQRASPFRRQSSPSSPSATIRPSTPTSSPGKGHTPIQSPSKLSQSYTVEDEEAVSGDDERATNERIAAPKFREPAPSPTRGANAQGSVSPMTGAKSPRQAPVDNDALTRLPPAQLREMREAFQVLDGDNDGSINRDDVADVLMNLGQDSSSAATSQYFPAGGAQTMNLPTFLNTLSTLLAPLSSQKELLNAFAAFDDDDSGQIDVAELRDALLHTNPEAGESPLTEKEIDEVLSGFTGRRAFGGKSARTGGLNGVKRGDVFRYQEFVSSIMGGADNGNGNDNVDKATAKG